MSQDIVERLRYLADKDEMVNRGFHLLIDEAADEIVKLRQQRDELVAIVGDLVSDLGKLKSAVRNLSQVRGRHNTQIAYNRLMDVFNEIDLKVTHDPAALAKIEGEK